MSQKIIDTYDPEDSDESLLINPEELTKRKRIIDEDISIAKTIEKTGNKFYNHGGMATVEFETMGRFNIPAVMYFNDYTTQDINDITLSRQEDLLKNLVVILNRSKSSEFEVNVEDMLLDEMLEILIGMKIEYNSIMHNHPWICDCQQYIESEAQVVNSTEIDLTTLKYKSIEEADESMKEYFKEIFEQLSDEQFQQYINIKYKNEPETNLENITKESELKKIKLEEPIGFKDDKENIYSFRFVRVKDLLDATKLVSLKYASKFKNIKNKQTPQNMPLVDFKNQKEKDLEDLQHQQGKDLVLYSKAFSLIKYNGKTLTKDESVKYYKSMPRKLLFRVNKFFEKIKFGIVDERELECPLCGNSSRRLLRQEFNPFEFLPLDDDSTNIKKRTTGLDIFIGI